MFLQFLVVLLVFPSQSSGGISWRNTRRKKIKHPHFLATETESLDQSEQIQSVPNKSAQSTPEKNEPVQSIPIQKEPVSSRPNENEPVLSRPNHSEPEQSKPIQYEPVQPYRPKQEIT